MPNKKFFPELESIRGLAAFTVVLEHWSSLQRIKGAFFTRFEFVMLDLSCLAVLTFFVLSGFVLTNALDKDKGGSV